LGWVYFAGWMKIMFMLDVGGLFGELLRRDRWTS
jgi:hypothetical protein